MVKISDEIEVYRMNEYSGNSSFIAAVAGYLYGLKEYVISPTVNYLWKCRVPECPAFIETSSEFSGSPITKVSEAKHSHFFNRQELLNLKKVSMKHSLEFSVSLSSSSASSSGNSSVESVTNAQRTKAPQIKAAVPTTTTTPSRLRAPAKPIPAVAATTTPSRQRAAATPIAAVAATSPRKSPRIKNAKKKGKAAPATTTSPIRKSPRINDAKKKAKTVAAAATTRSQGIKLQSATRSSGIKLSAATKKSSSNKLSDAVMPKRCPQVATTPTTTSASRKRKVGESNPPASKRQRRAATPEEEEDVEESEEESSDSDFDAENVPPPPLLGPFETFIRPDVPYNSNKKSKRKNIVVEKVAEDANKAQKVAKDAKKAEKVAKDAKKAEKVAKDANKAEKVAKDANKAEKVAEEANKAEKVAENANEAEAEDPSTSNVDKFGFYQYDQLDLFGDLENEEERPGEYERGEHYAADIGEVIENNKIKYQITRKMGFGNFSLAWLCYERNKTSNKFVALKIYKANNHSTKDEINNLKKVTNYDNIVQYFRSFTIKRNGFTHDCAVFEPLGSTLLTLLNRANNDVDGRKAGLKVDAIKKIARHIFLGLKHLHEDLKFVHTDIKPENVLTSVTDRSLFLAVKDVYDKDCKTRGMRGSCYVEKDGKHKAFKNGLENVKEDLNKILEDTPVPLSVEPASVLQNRDTVSDEICWDVVNFKLIDLGNAVPPSENPPTAGTFEYRAPENAFGAPLGFTFDTWGVGAVIVELATNRQLFVTVDKSHDNCDLMKSITRHLGKAPEDIYDKYPDPHDLLEYHYQDGEIPAFVSKSDVGFTQAFNLKKLFSRTYYTDEEVKDMAAFLTFLFNYDPKCRPTVAQCLAHEWLNC